MYTDEQIPRDLEHYMRQARKMRSEYLATLLRDAFAAVRRSLRVTVRTRSGKELPAGAALSGQR